MIWLVGETIVWLLAALVAGAITFFILFVVTATLRARAHELKMSREALDEYERVFDKLMDDPATPESARQLLIEFDHGVMHKRAAHFIATSMFRERAKWLKSGAEPEVLAEMREVGKHRPDLYEAFVTAIGSGFIATMLRWFFSARALSFIFVDPRRDPTTPMRAMASAADKKHNGDVLPAAA